MQTEIVLPVLKFLNFFLLKKVGAFLIASYPAIPAGFLFRQNLTFVSYQSSYKNSAESFSISCIFVPLLNNIVQPSAICGGVKDETNISNGKTTCS